MSFEFSMLNKGRQVRGKIKTLCLGLAALHFYRTGPRAQGQAPCSKPAAFCYSDRRKSTSPGDPATNPHQGDQTVYEETNIALDCPYCNEAIHETPSWFKKTYSTCPACDKGLAAGQFEAAIADLEEAMDADIEEMVQGKPPTGCGCKKSSCCH